MRIVFNLLNVGLGNNGGSKTLVRCAETLKELGNDVFIASQANNYTWQEIQVPLVTALPKTDIVVATGFSSVKSTLRANAAKKFYYIRGFETWRTAEKNLLASFKALKCIVNSEWLVQYFKKKKLHCDLVYPGLDFDLYPQKASVANRANIVGGLFHKKHRTKRHVDVAVIASRLGCKCLMLNRDLKNPTPEQLADFYNSIKVWITPSELEGLHNCPMEASLCGCGLVATDHVRGGTSDYTFHEKTCLKYKARDLEKANEYTERLLRDDELRERLQQRMITLLHNKIGDRKRNMARMLEIFKDGKPAS